MTAIFLWVFNKAFTAAWQSVILRPWSRSTSFVERFQGMDGLQEALLEEELVQDKAQESMDKSWSFPYFPQIDKELFECYP